MSENLIEDLYYNNEKIEYTQEDLEKDLSCANARNVVINKFRNFTEVNVFKKAFFITKPKQDVDRRRKFRYDDNRELQIARDGATFNDLITGLQSSRRRSVDNFFGYALSNKWRYFFTLTFDPKKIDRKNDEEIKYAWSLFRKKLQYRFPDIQIICVDELHKTDNCLHFHGFIGNADISECMTMAINNMKYLNTYDYTLRKKVYQVDYEGNLIPNKYYGHLLKTEYGDQIYNFTKKVFDFGFSSIIELHKENEECSNDKIIMYMQKYMSKDYNSVMYNKKAYYRTSNLLYKEKIITKSMDTSTGQVLNELLEEDKIIKKDNDKMTVYIIPNTKDYSQNNIYSVVEENKNESPTNVKIIKQDTQVSLIDIENDVTFVDDEFQKRLQRNNEKHIIKPNTKLFNEVNSVFPTYDLLDMFE